MTQQQPPPPSAAVTLESCHHCGELVPVGAFCGHCGSNLVDTSGGRSRTHAFAAAPHEQVARPVVISTLFPHLTRRHAQSFQLVLAAGILLVVALAALQLVAPATIAAAVVLPVLYLLYLYEVEVYQHEPVQVLLLTVVAGAALGVAFTLVTGTFTSASLNGTQQGVLVSAVLIPVIAQVLMVATPLLLLSHAHFDETLDGLTFGVATALGFTMATVIGGNWHLLTAPLVGGASSEDVLRILREGVLVAVVNASTTGLVTAALWLRVRRRSRRRFVSPWRGLQASVVVAFAVQIGLGLVSYYGRSLLAVVVAYAIVAPLLLIWLRVVLHFALLEEGAELEIGDATACPECHRMVPTMVFCPACGVARSASARQARPELPMPAAAEAPA
ncbi:MAG: PrsW family intramembrane metalloprotease [Candidatus Dormibacteraeota bacterium]|uniref:PrsW family intramembrane metalloprotease n=1 Tax=Candidatus Amunia macphersoniae TaxID=3127014 RepID=A0A934KJQ8_9BACT|nr:PrsW family intramembrane metalloprotease [Candidatus Dormibacteraeota bacterium]